MKNERDEKEALGQVINDYIRDRLRSGHRQAANYAHSLITLGWQARAEYGGDAEPIDVVLFCPKCKTQHIDKAEPDVCETCGHSKSEHFVNGDERGFCCDGCLTFTAWLNPPHKSHRCLNCNIVWRPADVPTNGVERAKTVGENDTKDFGINLNEKGDAEICGCGHDADNHQFGGANSICRVMSPCRKCDCRDFRPVQPAEDAGGLLPENEILKTARTVVGQNWTLTLSGGTAGNMQKYFQGESPDPPKWYYIYHKDKFESSGIIGPFNSASEAYTAFKKEAGRSREFMAKIYMNCPHCDDELEFKAVIGLRESYKRVRPRIWRIY